MIAGGTGSFTLLTTLNLITCVLSSKEYQKSTTPETKGCLMMDFSHLNHIVPAESLYCACVSNKNVLELKVGKKREELTCK